ncbi:MAG TPA: hypothetical protein VK750_00955 [Cytophagaceae bacterium]|jgi:hypothetical protein|nr:hypothetical protein [Cytophagaceae bacterium]
MSQSSIVEFQCVKKPEISSLSGFEVGKKYKGRTFNGLYQISLVWGGHSPSLMVDTKQFSKYFEVVRPSVIEKEEVVAA